MFPRKQLEKLTDGVMPPFPIMGETYFVGTYAASVHLIRTKAGLLMVDAGYRETFPMVLASMEKLGFDIRDVKHLILTHWHDDHGEAAALVKDMSGCEVLIGHRDGEKVKAFITPDRLLYDGDTVNLGEKTVCIMETPGHTAGTLSLFWEEAGKRLAMFGGAGVNTLKKGAFDYPDCRRDYLASLVRLKQERVDVMVGNHVWNNDTERKGRHLLETGENLFADASLWPRFLEFCEDRLKSIMEEEV